MSAYTVPMTATQSLHPLTQDLLRLVELVESLPQIEKTPEELDREATQALLRKARARNARRPFRPGQTR